VVICNDAPLLVPDHTAAAAFAEQDGNHGRLHALNQRRDCIEGGCGAGNRTPALRLARWLRRLAIIVSAASDREEENAEQQSVGQASHVGLTVRRLAARC
jgi:hypothetical protein